MLNIRRLRGLAYVTIDTGRLEVGTGLVELGEWLEDHPTATLLAINLNYASNDGENYILALIDCVEDDELS